MNTNRTIDAKLVVKYQSGDKEALTQLVKRWHLIFCKKAHWILKDADLAKDIAQESWQTIITKVVDLKDPERFGGWALRIVYSKSLDAIRNTTKERRKQEDYYLNQDRIIEEVNDNEAIKKELLKAIKALSKHQQHVITLFYVEEYSLKEISNLLSISIGTAKSRLFHAREKLKQQLKIYNYEK